MSLAVFAAAIGASWFFAACMETPTASAHLKYGKPHGKQSTRQWIAKHNLRHAMSFHKEAVPWLTRVYLRHARPSEYQQAMRWFNTSGARCVKSKEGGWTTNTGNGFYGAFQADYSFQRAHGKEFLARWGTANNWPSWAQIVMAYRGFKARFWHPWPNTARACGLL